MNTSPRLRHLTALIALCCPSVVLGQTTATERAAAGDILVQIDALQQRLDPAGRAKAIVSRRSADRDAVTTRVGALWRGEFEALADYIGRHPEVGWEEQATVDTLTAVLAKHGFRIERGVAGLETAFVATWDSPGGGEGPTLGLIAEYDALRGTDGPFHGDQHNAQSPVAFAAAISLKEYMAAHAAPGRIRIFGTPAEEVGPPAKSIMQDAGVFAGTDILVRSHSSTGTSRARAGFGVCCLNINQVKYIFRGRPSHQLTSWNGRNALEAAVRFYTSVDGLRSTLRPEASIQGVIPEGGVAPNVVPDRAVVDYYIRYPDGVYLEHMTNMIDDAARGAALATGTEVEIDRYGEFRDGIALGTLEELYYAYAERFDAPHRDPELQRPAGYEETGRLSHDVPGIGVSVFSSRATYHTHEMLADALGPVGHTGFELDARIMAAILFDYLTNAALRNAVHEEHQALNALLGEYENRLRTVYADEIR